MIQRLYLLRAAMVSAVLILLDTGPVRAEQALNWNQVKARFEASNPALRADADSVDETRAQQITASLRPNPQVGASLDGIQIAPNNGVWQPMQGAFISPSISYLHERDHKRELRTESAQQGTRISEREHEDLKRTLEFTLRNAFVNVLESKAVAALAKSDLDYYDRILEISSDRLRAGDLAQVDFKRIHLLRVQYESELQTALVNLRTAKIQLLQLLNDRTPVDQFDVSGPFEFVETLEPLDNYHQAAIASRPDLQAALAAIQLAETNHKLAIANGSTDPTVGAWYTWNSSTNNPNANQTIGGSVSIPLRVFDRNQGEKQRTQIEIDRSRLAAEAARAQVLSDVDSAYAQVETDISLLKPYRNSYNQEALEVRDTVTYAYQHGGASLMDFLNAQSDFRQVQLAYAQLVGAYLIAANQLNLAVGQEVIQ